MAVKTSQQRDKKNPGGRPPKFDEPSRPVTLTLPESVLDGLSAIDPDRSQAIVKLARAAMGQGPDGRPPVEIVEMVKSTGLLVIGPCQALRRIPFLHLIEVAPGRFLLALARGNDFKALEIALRDVLEDIPDHDKREKELVQLLLSNISTLRKSERVTMAEILFVNLDD